MGRSPAMGLQTMSLAAGIPGYMTGNTLPFRRIGLGLKQNQTIWLLI
jgi:hypothetical protein